MLADVVDALRQLTAAEVQIAGGKPKFKPVLRPITAFDQARRELRDRRHAHVLNLVEEARARARAEQQST